MEYICDNIKVNMVLSCGSGGLCGLFFPFLFCLDCKTFDLIFPFSQKPLLPVTIGLSHNNTTIGGDFMQHAFKLRKLCVVCINEDNHLLKIIHFSIHD